MKNHKGSGGKGPSRKVPSSSSAAGGGSRKSRRKPDDKSTLGRPVSSDSRHSKSKALPSTSPALVPKDHPTSPPFPAAWHRLFPISETAGPPSSPPPSYGFHNLERRTIVLADGSGRSYFALPPDPPIDPMADKFQYGRPGFGFGPEHDPALGFDKHFLPNSDGRFSPDFRQPTPYGRGRGLDGPRRHLEGGPSSLKRKYSEEDEFLWHRQHVMQHGNPNGIPVGPSGSGGDRINYLGGNNSPFRRDHHDELRLSKQAKLAGEIYEEMPQKKFRPDDVPPVFLDLDIQALKRAFLRLSKTINENSSQRKKYLEDGKNGPLQCVVCGRFGYA
ncbi:hypothetical protein BHE74_00051687 [Ensete ventricosum]|nr:hypothetical protein BHE74_00051687 [Ensete ventricosum]